MQQLNSSTPLKLAEDFNLLMMVLETDLLLAPKARLAHPLMKVALLEVLPTMVVQVVADLLNTMELLLVLLSLEVISSTLLLVATLMPSRVNLIPWMSALIIPLQHLNSITIIGLLVLSKTTDFGVILMHLNFAEMLMIA
jgi:hypothetical protein